MNITCDLLVLGAGPGGYVAAMRSAQLGMKTVCVEKEAVGGVCLNWGCIPSKALLFAGASYRQIGHLSAYGIKAEGVSFDPAALRVQKQKVVKQLVGGVVQLLKHNGVEVLNGRGEFVDAQKLNVKLNAGGEATVSFKKAILATGSRPAELPHLKVDGKNVWGAREALEFERWPKQLLVVGGGAIGVELADFFSSFGVSVTVVEVLPHLLPTLDKDLGTLLEREFKKRKIDVRCGSKVTALNVKGPNQLEATVEAGGKTEKIACDQVLVAIGQKPYLEGVAADRLGLKLDARGFIEVKPDMSTSKPGIYAIGDVTGRQLLAHKASHEGIVAAEAAAGKKSQMNWNAVPGAIFTEPEIATVGLTEQEATKAGHQVKVGKFPLAACGKAIATLHTEGFVKVVADAKDDTLLGAHIAGLGAADLIAPYTLALEMEATAEDVAHTIFVHPTLSEALGEAALDVDRHALHIYNPKRKTG